MSAELPVSDGDLWVCHACEMIGTYAQAKGHKIACGHKIEPVDPEIAEAVRVERQRRVDDFTVGLMGLARLNQSVAASTEKP